MLRLSQSTLGTLPPGLRRPRYDRTELKVGMAHIGVGAFHRCHQAEFTDDMLEQRFGDWGVVGINVRPPLLRETIGAQDGLYTRTLRQGRESDVRVIGCIRRVIDGSEDIAAAITALASPDISVVTMTITEKGYCHIPATGHLDEQHPDIIHDLAFPLAPQSVIGLLAQALEQRRTAHGQGLTLVSCDNIPANGRVLMRVLLSFAQQRDPGLATWISEEVRFPSTMVDRIVPAAQPADLLHASLACGLEDRASVIGEPFRQWVLEDEFGSRRPDWDLAGATFVAEVEPYELVKMRLLNAAQSAWAYFGVLSGLEHTCDAARDPLLGPLVERMLIRESSGTVPVVAGMEPGTYIPLVLSRVRNEAILHTNHQVATDGSQKLVQRFLNPIRDCIGSGRPFDILALGVAGWMAYLLSAASRFGLRWTAHDPWADQVLAIAASGGDAQSLVREIVGIEPIFGTDLKNGAFPEQVSTHVKGLLSQQPRQYLARMLAAG